jgi:hypothetical protein
VLKICKGRHPATVQSVPGWLNRHKPGKRGVWPNQAAKLLLVDIQLTPPPFSFKFRHAGWDCSKVSAPWLQQHC